MPAHLPALAAVALAALATLGRGAPATARAADCSFAKGTTTCTSVAQSTETTTHIETSGCRFGPDGIPARRSRTIEDTWLVTVTTATFAHGRHGPVYDTSSATTREHVGSVQISDVCEVL